MIATVSQAPTVALTSMETPLSVMLAFTFAFGCTAILSVVVVAPSVAMLMVYVPFAVKILLFRE
ncbi:hypothetical protein AGMMS50276_26200 [Synergistales bacterium]|nr:hypothetical protein AGMMS50276_26200 [Synergistales bacterium]